jgi:small-conductance mechanosensitive channel
VFDPGEWRTAPIFNNSVTSWLVAGGIFILVLSVLIGLRVVVRRYAERLRSTTRTELLEIPLLVLSRTTLVFITIAALFAGTQALDLGTRVQHFRNTLLTIAFFWQLGVWVAAAVGVWIERRRQHSSAENRAALSSLGIIRFISNVVIWALVMLATLDNLGVNITALVAGLGVGGVAVALALQNVLGDLFASLSIALDRPFEVGDFLAVDTFLGAVENIGIKSTRLRSLDGEQIIISNGDLLKSRVRNFGRMDERRVQFATAVAYGTPVEEIERIPGWIREFIEAEPDTRFDRSHFLKHGERALEFESVYYVLSADFNKYMDIQQSINLKIHRRLTEHGIAFAIAPQGVIPAAAPSPDSNAQGPEEAPAAREPGRARAN